MDLDFSRQRLVENISTLMKERQLKVGEVEQTIGISTGYLSKMLKKDTESSPAADTIWKLAKVFGVSTDMLIEGDFSKATDNLLYIGNFLTKLKEMTDGNLLEWESITIDDINQMLMSENPIFPIIHVDTEDSGKTASLHESYQGHAISAYQHRKNRIKSKEINQGVTWVDGVSFRASLSWGTYIYIFPMCTVIDVGEGLGTEEVTYYDIYFRYYHIPDGVDENEVTLDMCQIEDVPVCNTCTNANELYSNAHNLYYAIKRHEQDLRIKDSVRQTIEYFMNCNLGNGDELPF